MELAICDFTLSKKLKQIGFNYPQPTHYDSKGELFKLSTGLFQIDCYAPTQALAKKFLLDTYNLHIECKPFESYAGKNCFTIVINNMDSGSDGYVCCLRVGNITYEDFEKCEHDAIEEAIEIIMDKKFHSFSFIKTSKNK